MELTLKQLTTNYICDNIDTFTRQDIENLPADLQHELRNEKYISIYECFRLFGREITESGTLRKFFHCDSMSLEIVWHKEIFDQVNFHTVKSGIHFFINYELNRSIDGLGALEVLLKRYELQRRASLLEFYRDCYFGEIDCKRPHEFGENLNDCCMMRPVDKPEIAGPDDAYIVTYSNRDVVHSLMSSHMKVIVDETLGEYHEQEYYSD